MKQVSFDFDSTLDRVSIQLYAKSLLKKGIKVWIITSRPENFDFIQYSNEDLFKVAKEVGIPRENIIFTGYEEKWETIKDMDLIFHLDDDSIELKRINKNTNTVGISCWRSSTWKNKCDKLLK